MINKYLYQVYPSEPMRYFPEEKISLSLSIKQKILLGVAIFSLIYGIICLVSAFLDVTVGDLYKADFLFGAIALIPFSLVAFYIFYNSFKNSQKKIKEAHKSERIKYAKDAVEQEAQYYTIHINELLDRSKEISNKILHYYYLASTRLLKLAKVDFKENAISPFWERVEEVSREFGLWKESVHQLLLNGELYTKVLSTKNHNFPIPFPIEINSTAFQKELNEYNIIIRNAQKNTAFATIWEIRRNTQVNIAGFRTLSDAVYNMSNMIETAISNLNDSLKSEFIQLKNFQEAYLNSFETSQHTINKMLTEMNNKLYYIQYKRNPNSPFIPPN